MKVQSKHLIKLVARIWSLVSIAIVILFLVGEGFTPAQLTTLTEKLLVIFFPFGVSLGMIIAWFREKTGGIITVTCLLLFYAVHLVGSGNLPNGPWFALIAAPGLLFLISTLHNDKSSAHQRRNSVSDCS